MPPWTATKMANSTNKIGDTQELTQAKLTEGDEPPLSR